MNQEKPKTHAAYAKKREGRTAFRLLEIGTARIESDGNGPHIIEIDRLPIGGFSGRVYLYPIGIKPEDLEPQPRYPGENSDSADI